MNEHPLPRDVRDLVAHAVTTMEHVEVLLALAGTPDRGWTPPDVAAEIRGSTDSVARRLEDLVGCHLAMRDDSSFPPAFRYAPQTPALRAATSNLAEMYRTKPVSLVKAIYERPPASVQSFADAFRVRKPEA